MRVEIDEKSGFCYGVVSAISKAEELLGEGRKVFSLGEVVHNDLEVARLERAGVTTIDHQQLQTITPNPANTVLIRAHGEPKSTYRTLAARSLDYADATCPVVAKLQRQVATAYAEMEAVGGAVLILGKKGHAEVVGLNGQIDNRGVVIESIEDLDAVDFSRPIYLISQTTQSLALFHQVSSEVLKRSKEPSTVVIKDTICRQVAGREEHLRAFASQHDVILFACGHKSSNGKVLFEACRQANQRSYKIEGPDEIDFGWLEGAESVGICGATSTPHWLMEAIAEAIAPKS